MFYQKQQHMYKTITIFQVVNIIFVLLFETNAHQTRCNGYFLPTIEIKDYNIIIEAFANRSSVNIKFLKTQLSKMIQFERLNFLDLINPADAVINNIN